MGLGIARKLKNKFFKYKPYEYWKKRGVKYEEKFKETLEMNEQEQVLLQCLDKLSFNSVLEFGCGFGRMTKIILANYPVKRYLAFDFSPDQVNNARKNCNIYENVEFQVSTIEELVIKEKFDLVFGAEVLLHIPPQNINEIIQQLVNLTDRNFINIDFFPETPPNKMAPHNFIHPYLEIFNKIQKIKDTDVTRINKQQCIFNSTVLEYSEKT